METNTVDLLKARLAERKGRWPDVARAAGVPISTVRKIAQGYHKNPRINTVDKITRALDLSERISAKYGRIAA